MSKEYIEREAAIAKCNKLLDNAYSCPNPSALEGVTIVRDLILMNCETGVPTADVAEIVRCKNCRFSSEPTAASRYDLYCNNYDVCFCERDQRIVCGTHFCGYGAVKIDGKGGNNA